MFVKKMIPPRCAMALLRLRRKVNKQIKDLLNSPVLLKLYKCQDLIQLKNLLLIYLQQERSNLNPFLIVHLK